jgi:putative endonuclease
MTSDARPAALRTTKARGGEAERRALAHLAANGLVPVERNYRVARGPRSRGGEIDLILRDADGADFPQAATAGLRRSALPWPVRLAAALPLRCVTVEGERIEWLRAAFDAS